VIIGNKLLDILQPVRRLMYLDSLPLHQVHHFLHHTALAQTPRPHGKIARDEIGVVEGNRLLGLADEDKRDILLYDARGPLEGREDVGGNQPSAYSCRTGELVGNLLQRGICVVFERIKESGLL
jgi:hypothetical protein